jgi:hypothetical protein
MGRVLHPDVAPKVENVLKHLNRKHPDTVLFWIRAPPVFQGRSTPRPTSGVSSDTCSEMLVRPRPMSL